MCMTRSGDVMPSSARVSSAATGHPQHIKRYKIRAEHSHTSATELRQKRMLLNYKQFIPYLNPTTDYASVVPTVHVRH